MSSTNGDDFQEVFQTDDNGQPELELEAGPRAERPNFLTATRFTDFDLPPEILEGLDKAGFEYCTPIQAQAIPVALSGQDIAGQAQTGTGKTTAFLAPLLTRLLKNKPLEPGVPRALIITPTRELALQIYEDAQVLAGATGMRLALVIGGIEYKEQAELLASGPEVVICTPGRLIDYLQQGVFKTKGIEVAVVDEADRLLDMGFIKDLKQILGRLPSFDQRQTMLFSATLDERVMELTYQYMNPPQYITAEPDKATKINIEQELYHIGRDEKLSLLMGLLRREEHHRVIIFSNTKSGVEWLAKKLTMNGFQAEGITGDLPQPKRLKLMEAFKENRLQILVATDVASRGIHVDDVSHVYNYDLPQDAENYIHRIGRTARAGHAGKAVSFGCEDYVFHLEAIENILGYKIPVFWAEQEWFMDDQGGEVRLKERRGGERKKGPGRGRETGGGRIPRGPAKSQRPGGIFGLSPRTASDGRDERQKLGWTVPGDEELIVDAEIVEISKDSEAEAPERENGKPDRDRRRKRRRGRRGGSQAAPDAPAAVEAAPAEAVAAAEPSRYPTARVAAQSASPTEAKAEPATIETVAAAKEPGAAPEQTVRKAAAKKPRRASAKKAGGKPEAVAAEAQAPPVEREAAEKPEETPTKAAPKTRRGAVKKTAAEKAKVEEAVVAAPQAAAEEPRPAAKKPVRAAKKAEDGAEKPKKTAAAKAKAEASDEPVKKTGRSKKAAMEEAAPAPEKAVKKASSKTSARASAPSKKAEAAASPESAVKKAEVKADESAPKKTRTSAKKTGDATEDKKPTARKTAAKTGGTRKKSPAKTAGTPEEQS